MPAVRAAVVHDGTSWLLEDHGSRNGTLLNGLRPPAALPEFTATYGTDFFSVAPPAHLGAIAAIAVATGALTPLFVRRAGRPAS